MKKFAILLVPLIGSELLLGTIACGGSSDESPSLHGPQSPSSTASERQEISEPVEITIGNLTDITGPGASAVSTVDMALRDLVSYYNENNLIPGVKLGLINYDVQFDPSKDIPGYNWLKEHGADLIFTAVPDTPLTLKSIVDMEEIPLFAASGYQEMLNPPGYVFVMGPIPEHQAYTLLDWISRNDWDYQSSGPARIGGASWNDGYSQSFISAMKRYSMVHQDQFEWVEGYLTNFSFTWGPEVASLKNCDYVFPCVMPVAFMKEYRSEGGRAKFIGADVHTTFLKMIKEAKLWDKIDGMLFIRGGSLWWNEEDPMIDLAKDLLYKYHHDEAEDIMKAGSSYISSAVILYPMIEIVADAVKNVGAENVSSRDIYEAAKSYSLKINGIERSGFTQMRRYALNNYLIYGASATEEDIVRLDENWIPLLAEP